MKTYTYGTLKVEVNEKGIVTHTDTDLCAVGQKANTQALKACGWKLSKTPTVYYSHGTTSSNRFAK